MQQESARHLLGGMPRSWTEAACLLLQVGLRPAEVNVFRYKLQMQQESARHLLGGMPRSWTEAACLLLQVGLRPAEVNVF